ncbi:hypothetical protein C2L92_10810 [Coxiella burnetii]|nr:hypothetical protein CbuQ195_08425 [Coxiella burnetii]PNT78486.1 hypothetical protein C2L92_10810 [Coxiella burnetii]PNT78950.1 hypothetical protein C2L91_10840 [Coxiella burnetii]PNT82707.1 hypothetical protein C2L90_10755 [Coxiella burnetii]PNT85657.1 hypothetical protein C2L94_10810 [Coxiella burnetii]
MSEAKYGKTMMSSIVPVFRFAHTGYLAPGPARWLNLHFQSHPAPTLKLNIDKALVGVFF